MSDQNKNQQSGHDENADKKNQQQGQPGNQQNQQQKHQPQSEHDKDSMGNKQDRKQA